MKSIQDKRVMFYIENIRWIGHIMKNEGLDMLLQPFNDIQWITPFVNNEVWHKSNKFSNYYISEQLGQKYSSRHFSTMFSD